MIPQYIVISQKAKSLLNYWFYHFSSACCSICPPHCNRPTRSNLNKLLTYARNFCGCINFIIHHKQSFLFINQCYYMLIFMHMNTLMWKEQAYSYKIKYYYKISQTYSLNKQPTKNGTMKTTSQEFLSILKMQVFSVSLLIIFNLSHSILTNQNIFINHFNYYKSYLLSIFNILTLCSSRCKK